MAEGLDLFLHYLLVKDCPRSWYAANHNLPCSGSTYNNRLVCNKLRIHSRSSVVKSYYLELNRLLKIHLLVDLEKHTSSFVMLFSLSIRSFGFVSRQAVKEWQTSFRNPVEFNLFFILYALCINQSANSPWPWCLGLRLGCTGWLLWSSMWLLECSIPYSKLPIPLFSVISPNMALFSPLLSLCWQLHFQAYFVAHYAWRLMSVLYVLFQELPGFHAHEVQPVQRRPLYPWPEQPSIWHHSWSDPLLHHTQTPHQRSRTLVPTLPCVGSDSVIGQGHCSPHCHWWKSFLDKHSTNSAIACIYFWVLLVFDCKTASGWGCQSLEWTCQIKVWSVTMAYHILVNNTFTISPDWWQPDLLLVFSHLPVLFSIGMVD